MTPLMDFQRDARFVAQGAEDAWDALVKLDRIHPDEEDRAVFARDRLVDAVAVLQRVVRRLDSLLDDDPPAPPGPSVPLSAVGRQ